MKIIDAIKSWPVQKKVFASLASATIIIGGSYGIIKIVDYFQSKNKNKKQK